MQSVGGSTVQTHVSREKAARGAGDHVLTRTINSLLSRFLTTLQVAVPSADIRRHSVRTTWSTDAAGTIPYRMTTSNTGRQCSAKV